jgi:cellulose synthase/poly-beta-1,6-N-acetylglucosamine synthase-like glycosyltransferase
MGRNLETWDVNPEGRIAAERRFARRFFALVLGIWLVTVAVFAATTVNFGSWISLVQFSLMVFFLFSFSIVFSKRVVSLVVKPYPLPRLDAIARQPRVAILYTTMNDVVPECVNAIRQTYPVDVFMLDDSSDPYKRAIVDDLARVHGFRTLRRAERKGFKAGAINQWLSLHGSDYDYFVLLDADSVLPTDWVAETLKYAEHPDNAHLAIFQGMINIWNTDKPFPRALAAGSLLGQDEWERRVSGYLGAVFCYGHNVLIRTRPVLETGGFVEDFVSEDFATAVRLASSGFGSVFVPLHTWEAMPENVRGFVRRQTKWTRGSMEFWSFVPPARVPWYKKILLYTTPMNHVAYIAIMAAMVAAVFGRISSFGAFLAFGQNLVTAPILYIWSISLFRFIIVLSLITSVFTFAKLAQVHLGFWKYYRARTLSKAIGAIMLPHEVRAMIMYLVDPRRKFPVTPKDEPPMTMREILHIGRGTVALVAAMGLGLTLWNPVGLWYNALWFVSFLTAPLVLYYYCGPFTRSAYAGDRTARELLADPRLRTSLDLPGIRW